MLLRATGQLAEAEAAQVEAQAISKQLAADFPARPEFRQALAGMRTQPKVWLNYCDCKVTLSA